MATPAIVGSAVGFPKFFGQHIQNAWSSNQGDSVVVSPAAGNALVVVVLGLKSYAPFDLLHTGNANQAYLPDLLSFAAAPVVSDSVVDAATITNSQEDTVALTLTGVTAHAGPFTLTQVVNPAGPFTLSAVANSVGSSATYTGTITGGDANNFAGMSFTIAGFVGGTNNGTFLCTASTATTLVLSNAAAVAEAHAGTATNSVATNAVYVGTITGGAANAFANYQFTVAGFGTGANNGLFTCVASTATTLVLTNGSRVAETHAGSAEAGTTGSGVYFGTITGGAANALAGYMFQIASFVTVANNGYFLCTASTATALTLVNAAAVSEIHAGTATPNIVTITAANNFNVGDVVTYSGLTTATWLNGQSQAIVTVSASQFTTNDSAKHATSASHADGGLATRSSGNDWVAAGGQLSLGDADYTASLGDFTRSSQWALDGYYPSVYIFYALNVTAGTYKVSVNSCYQDGVSRPADLAAGKPIFDGGVDIHVFEFSGVAASAASDGAQGGMSAANPAVSPTFTTTSSGDLIISAGIMKSGNAFSVNSAATDTSQGTTGTVMLASGKCVGSQAHWGIQMQLQTANGAITPGFANPLGYEMAVKTLALKHS